MKDITITFTLSRTIKIPDHWDTETIPELMKKKRWCLSSILDEGCCICDATINSITEIEKKS